MTTTNDTYATIVEIVKREGDVDGAPSADADIYRDLGVESTKAIAILVSLEEQFGLTLEDAEFVNARTINGLVALVERLATT